MRTARFLAPLPILLPQLVFASPRTISDFANMIVEYIDTAVFLLISFAVVVYFYGLGISFRSMTKDPQKRTRLIVYGLLAIFVMVSVWGIVSLLRSSLFGSASNNTPSPQQTQSCPFGGTC